MLKQNVAYASVARELFNGFDYFVVVANSGRYGNLEGMGQQKMREWKWHVRDCISNHM